MKDVDLQPLIKLGLTNLEAAIYAFLLENSPATGYGIAKGIRKPAANTYKALESLQSKGAIIIEDSRTRLCRAIPVDELLDSFQRTFDSLKSRTKAELKKLKPSPQDSRVYQLQTIDQVISRYRQMLASCEKIAMLDFFPFVVETLEHDIIAAAKRGVRVNIKIYQPHELPGANIIITADSERMLKIWPGQWANGVIDGREYLLAFVSRDAREVYEAVWSNNHYLSWIYYDGLAKEIIVTALKEGIYGKAKINELKQTLKNLEKMFSFEAADYEGASSILKVLAKSNRKIRRKYE